MPHCIAGMPEPTEDMVMGGSNNPPLFIPLEGLLLDYWLQTIDELLSLSELPGWCDRPICG